MRTRDFKLSEIDILTSKSDMRSLDPEPSMDRGMHPSVIKDLVYDHIKALRHMSRYLPRSPDLDVALSDLQDEYDKLLGRRLTELSSAEINPAVLELRRALKKLAAEDNPDLSYRNIDIIMRGICKQQGCDPADLHDAFVSTFDATPDEWIRELLRK